MNDIAMQEQMTQPSLYQTNHASFVLPPQLKDKTVHMFTLNDNGPSDFSVIISHAPAEPEESLAEFGERLVREMDKGLARFMLASSQERLVDGAPALELRYSWRKEGHFLHQRQLITLVPGAVAGTRQAMMIGATCMRPFTAEFDAAFEGILESMKLRHPPAPEASDSGDTVAPAQAAATTVFALSERRRTLHVYVDRDEACRKTDAREVEQDAWAFFDAAGAPLKSEFVVPNSGTVFRKAGTFVLSAQPDPAAPALQERLHLASMLVASSPALPFTTIADVQASLGLTGKG